MTNGSSAVVNNISSAMSNNVNVALSLCKVTKVDSQKMTVDVYLPDVATVLYNVPICFPSKGVGYGSFFMPKEGSWYLIVLANSRRPYLLASPYVTSNDATASAKERVLAGENLLQAIGGAYLKQDLVGNQILRSIFGNGAIFQNNGINSFHSNGKEEITIASKVINGFGLDLNEDTDNFLLNNQDAKVINYEEYYSKIGLPVVYKPNDIAATIDGILTINETTKQNILGDARSTIAKIYGDNTSESLYDKLYHFKEQMHDGSLTDAEITDSFSAVTDYLNNNFNIAKKGVKIVIEKGNAISKNVDSITDATKLIDSDFVQETDGDDICLRLSVVEISTNSKKFELAVDVQGHLRLNVKSFDIIEG